MAKRKKEKNIFRRISRRRRNISRFILVAIAIGLISMFLAALWSHAYSRWGNTANRDESGYLETSPDYVSSEQEWVIKEMYDYNSKNYMLDDMPDLARRSSEHQYVITFTFGDTTNIPCF
ncbi:MAG: hypothetical protein K6F57_02115 [Candidatus Saccharibacteria bacterium]|nr:hypothetical protein [Candidatus Saccharibacteria bacterium]